MRRLPRACIRGATAALLLAVETSAWNLKDPLIFLERRLITKHGRDFISHHREIFFRGGVAGGSVAPISIRFSSNKRSILSIKRARGALDCNESTVVTIRPPAPVGTRVNGHVTIVALTKKNPCFSTPAIPVRDIADL